MASPRRVADINPGRDGSLLSELTAFGNLLFFRADDGRSGYELWKSDGTAASTTRVADIRQGTDSSRPRFLTPAGNALFFAALDDSSGTELWKTDGTNAGTVRVADIRRGRDGSFPTLLTALGNTLFFRAIDDSSGYELWKTNGTAAGTARVADINPGGAPSHPRNLTTVGETLFFDADDGSSGFELWKTDGTASGTVRVADIYRGIASSIQGNFRPPGSFFPMYFPRTLAAVGGTLFFYADDGSSGFEIWKSDGTAAGTVRVADINPGGASSIEFPQIPMNSLVASGNSLFFNATDGTSGNELWKTDGTAAGTVRVADINKGNFSSYPLYLTAVGNTLYFRADDGKSGLELWKSDGTAAGTVRVADINPGSASSYPRNLTVVGNTLFFEADDGSSGFELWKTDGTVIGTARISDINPGNASSNPSEFTAVGNTLFFKAHDGISGFELWALDISDVSTPTIPTTTASITAVTDNVGLLQGTVAANGRTDDRTPTITGRISAALAAGETLRIYRGDTLLGSATVNNKRRTWSYTPALPATTGSTYPISARVADAAGILGAASPVRRFTLDTTPPTTTAFSPLDGAAGVAQTANITLTFSESMRRGTGTAELRLGSAAGALVESFDVATSNRIGFNDRQITFNPTANLAPNTQYFLNLSAGSFTDLAGIPAATINTYHFRTINAASGTSANDTLLFTSTVDQLTGLESVDRFRLSSLQHALLPSDPTTPIDRITDLVTGVDRIDAPISRTLPQAVAPVLLGSVSALNATAITALLTPAALPAFTTTSIGGVAAFTYSDPGAGTRTFLAINNNVAGFSAASDAIIEITGYSGNLSSLQVY